MKHNIWCKLFGHKWVIWGNIGKHFEIQEKVVCERCHINQEELGIKK